MEAKDTIISDQELIEMAEMLYNLKDGMDIEGIKSILWQQANHQAEIAFKAGQESRQAEIIELTREREQLCEAYEIALFKLHVCWGFFKRAVSYGDDYAFKGEIQ